MENLGNRLPIVGSHPELSLLSTLKAWAPVNTAFIPDVFANDSATCHLSENSPPSLASLYPQSHNGNPSSSPPSFPLQSVAWRINSQPDSLIRLRNLDMLLASIGGLCWKQSSPQKPVRILYPLSHSLFIRQTLQVLQILQPNHQAYGFDGTPVIWTVQFAKGLIKYLPVDNMSQFEQRVSLIQLLVKTITEQVYASIRRVRFRFHDCATEMAKASCLKASLSCNPCQTFARI